MLHVLLNVFPFHEISPLTYLHEHFCIVNITAIANDIYSQLQMPKPIIFSTPIYYT